MNYTQASLKLLVLPIFCLHFINRYDFFCFVYISDLDDSIVADALRYLMLRLPKWNYKMAQILFRHLSIVSSHSDTNKMTAYNLGVCFGPSLMRDRRNIWSVECVKLANKVVQRLIENYDLIFGPRDLSFYIADVDALFTNWHVRQLEDNDNNNHDNSNSNSLGAFIGAALRSPSFQLHTFLSALSFSLKKDHHNQHNHNSRSKIQDNDATTNPSPTANETAENNNQIENEAKRLSALLIRGHADVDDDDDDDDDSMANNIKVDDT